MEANPLKEIRQPVPMLGLLDFCKGVAIVWVMLVHGLHGWFGGQGAHVFILLGGFAYASLTRENQLSWGQWFRRRAARILPAYWIVATAGFIVIWIVAVLVPNVKRPFDLSVAILRWLGDLTLLGNFSYKTMLADPNSALWFIPLIAGFLTHLLFGYAHASLFPLWVGKPVLIVLMLVLTLAGMIAASWLLLRLDRSGFPKRLFSLGAAVRQGTSVTEAKPAVVSPEQISWE